MSEKPWAHLPNARHIDAVLADVRARPEVWSAAWDAAWDAPWDAPFTASRDAVLDAVLDAARGAVLDAARGAVRDAARDAVRGAVRGAAWVAVRDAIRALIAWDSSTDLLDLPPDVLRTMADLAPEPVCHQAVLLLPYAMVRAAG